MTVRPPNAGIWGFYPVERELLVKTLERCFKDEVYGPGRLPGPRRSGRAIGGIAPHAGYTYSGPCAAWLYLRLAEEAVDFDTVVVIGTNHTGYGGRLTTTTYYTKWTTPLGDVSIDSEFTGKLVEAGVVDDHRAHEQEHSVEVQLPFLQYVFKNNWKLVPLVAQPMTPREAEAYASLLEKTASDLGRTPLYIVSSDFTHHGPMYGYVLYTVNPIEKVGELDAGFIESIEKLDLEEFYSLINRYKATVCGWPAIMILMSIARRRELGLKLLKYYNSGELTGDESVIVGYASIIATK